MRAPPPGQSASLPSGAGTAEKLFRLVAVVCGCAAPAQNKFAVTEGHMVSHAEKYFQPLCNILCNISGNTYTLFCITCVPPIYVFSYGCAHMHYVAYSMQCHVFPRNKNKKNKKLFLQGLSSGYAGENAVHLFFRTTHI